MELSECHGNFATRSIYQPNLSLRRGIYKHRDLITLFTGCSGKQGHALRSAYSCVCGHDIVDTVTLLIVSLEAAGLDPCHAVDNLIVRNV